MEVADDEFDALVKIIDTNNDGQISAKEFEKFFKKLHLQS